MYDIIHKPIQQRTKCNHSHYWVNSLIEEKKTLYCSYVVIRAKIDNTLSLTYKFRKNTKKKNVMCWHIKMKWKLRNWGFWTVLLFQIKSQINFKLNHIPGIVIHFLQNWVQILILINKYVFSFFFLLFKKKSVSIRLSFFLYFVFFLSSFYQNARSVWSWPIQRIYISFGF